MNWKAYEEVHFSANNIQRWVREGDEYVNRMTLEQMGEFQTKVRQQADRIAELEFENKAFRKELFNIGSMRSCSYAAQHHGFVSPRQAGDDAREYIAEILEKAKREIK